MTNVLLIYSSARPIVVSKIALEPISRRFAFNHKSGNVLATIQCDEPCFRRFTVHFLAHSSIPWPNDSLGIPIKDDCLLQCVPVDHFVSENFILHSAPVAQWRVVADDEFGIAFYPMGTDDNECQTIARFEYRESYDNLESKAAEVLELVKSNKH